MSKITADVGSFKAKIIVSNEFKDIVEITNINGNMPAEALKSFLNLDQNELICLFKDHIKELNNLDGPEWYINEYLCKIKYLQDSETFITYCNRDFCQEETSYFWSFELIWHRKTG